MDFNEAIAAHSAWKTKLKTYLKNPDRSLKAADIEVDNKCVLGQWIYGEGKKWSSTAGYSELKTEHAKFHKAAADIVRRADSGQSVCEEVTIGAASDFGTASAAVVRHIVRMREKVH